MWIVTNIKKYILEKMLDVLDDLYFYWDDEMQIIGATTITQKLIVTLSYAGILLCAIAMIGIVLAICFGWF